MKKKIILALCFLGMLFSLSAASGSLIGQGKLRVTKTVWFDLIYPASCQQTAAILYENADRIYEEVTEQYGFTPQFRMPVVITPAVDSFNAFWTIAPYNHIVVYDTSITDMSELAVFSETLLSCFRHEVTHGVTYNMKNKFWQVTSSIFGDPVVPGMLLISSGMAEGAAVASESAGGEGRMNNEYSKQYIKQARLEGNFPSYFDVMGAGDKGLSGIYYYFHGAFHYWLQQKYGLEAYANFWYSLVNLKKLTVSGAFYKAYGIKLKDAWAQFADDIQVPEIAANPVKINHVNDFFDSTKNEYSSLNANGALYSSLVTSDKWVAWYDNYGRKIMYVDVEEAKKSRVKPKVLFSVSGLSQISLSQDGRYLVLSCFNQNKPGTSAQIKIYDTQTKQLFTVKESGLKNGAILKKGDEYFLVANKFVSPCNTLKTFKIITNSRQHITQVEEAAVLRFSSNEYCTNMTAYKDNQFACVKNNQLKYSVCIYNSELQLVKEYAAPVEGMIINSLSVNNDDLYFSWASSGTMPRLGKLNGETGEMQLASKDISGGVYDPVKAGDRIVYIGTFYAQSRLLVLPDSAEDCRMRYDDDYKYAQKYTLQSAAVNAGSISERKTDVSESAAAPESDSELEYKFYNPFNYLTRGIFAPVSTYETSYFGSNAAYSSTAAYYPLGITYITANPWTNGANDLFMFTSGWSYLSNSFGMEMTAKQGTDTSLFSSSLDVKTEFDSSGFKQAGAKLTLGSGYYIGKRSAISVSNTSTARIGRQDSKITGLTLFDQFRFWDDRYFELSKSLYDTNYYTVSDVFKINYSNIMYAGPGRYQKKGISFTLGLSARKDGSISELPEVDVESLAFISGFQAYIPRLLPFEVFRGLTYNLPTHMSLSLMPTASNYSYASDVSGAGRSLLDISTETVLIGTEIQKAVPFFTPLYLNDCYLSLGYSGSLTSGQMNYSGFQLLYLPEYVQGIANGQAVYIDSVYLKSVVELTPNIGAFASSTYKMNLYVLFAFMINTPQAADISKRASLNIGFQSIF